MARKIKNTYAVRLVVEDGGKARAELVDTGRTGEKSLDKIRKSGKSASRGLGSLTDRARSLSRNLKVMAAAATAAAAVGGLSILTKNAISSANALGDTADKLGVNVEALQELRFAAKQAGVEQNTFDMGLQRFIRRVGEAARGSGEAKEALETMGITLRDNNGNIRAAEDLLNDVADALKNTRDPAERLRLAFKLFDSEGVALVNVLAKGSDELEKTKQRARDLGIVIEEDLIRDAGKAADEMDVLQQVVSANLNRALLDLSPLIADTASGLSELAADAGSAYEKLKLIFRGDFALEGRSLRVLNHDLANLKEEIGDIEADLERRRALQEEGGLKALFGGGTEVDIIHHEKRRAEILEQIRETEEKIRAIRGEREDAEDGDTPSGPGEDGIQALLEKEKELQRLVKSLDKQLFDLTHEGTARIEAEYQKQIELIKAAADPDEVEALLARALEVKTLRLEELADKETQAEMRRAEQAEKRAEAEERRKQKALEANEAVTESLEREIAALGKSERQNFIDQAVRRLSANATQAQRREVEQLAGALFDEQQAMEARRKEEERRKRLIEDIKRLTDEQAAAQDKYNEEMAELNRLLKEGAINQQEFEAASKRARDNMLQHSREWSAGVQRALRDYADEATDMASQVQQVTTRMIQGLEDALVEFTTTGKFNWRDMVDSMIADITRLIIRTQITGPLAGALNNAIGGFFANADGNVFSGGMPVRAFGHGTVVHDPTVFPMANGIGLMGEEGPEAIMPLRRLPSGRLGVEATGNKPAYAISVDARGATDPAATARQVEVAVDRALTARVPGIVKTSVSAARSEVVDMWHRRGGRFD